MRSESRAKRRLRNRARRDKLSDFSIHGRTSSSWPYRLRSVAHLRNSVESAIGNADLFSGWHDAVIRAYDERATSSKRTSTPANSRSHETHRSPPCRHGKKFGFAFRVKYCSRTSPGHGRYVVLARAANYPEWSEQSYQYFHVSIS